MCSGMLGKGGWTRSPFQLDSVILCPLTGWTRYSRRRFRGKHSPCKRHKPAGPDPREGNGTLPPRPPHSSARRARGGSEGGRRLRAGQNGGGGGSAGAARGRCGPGQRAPGGDSGQGRALRAAAAPAPLPPRPRRLPRPPARRHSAGRSSGGPAVDAGAAPAQECSSRAARTGASRCCSRCCCCCERAAELSPGTPRKVRGDSMRGAGPAPGGARRLQRCPAPPPVNQLGVVCAVCV